MSMLKSFATAAIVAIVAIAVSAGPALASTGGNSCSDVTNWCPPTHQVPVGSIAGGLGVAVIAGIGLVVAQRRRRRSLAAKP